MKKLRSSKIKKAIKLLEEAMNDESPSNIREELDKIHPNDIAKYLFKKHNTIAVSKYDFSISANMFFVHGDGLRISLFSDVVEESIFHRTLKFSRIADETLNCFEGECSTEEASLAIKSLRNAADIFIKTAEKMEKLGELEKQEA